MTIGTSGNAERQVSQEKNGFNTEYESISLTYRFYMNFSGSNKSAELQQICLFSLQADFMLFILVVVSQMWRLEYKCVLLHKKNVKKANEEYEQNYTKLTSHATATHRDCIFPLG